MILNSYFQPLVDVSLPYKGRQRYMHGFDCANPTMEAGFEDYLEPAKALLKATGVAVGKAWMTVDEKIVKAGESQRRPGPHVDGKFNSHMVRWSGGGGWNHSCNLIPTERTPVIVASSTVGCRAWMGQFEGTPAEDGDLGHIRDQLGEPVVFEPGVGYLMSGDCVHESPIMTEDTQRTFLRIALPQLEGVSLFS